MIYRDRRSSGVIQNNCPAVSHLCWSRSASAISRAPLSGWASYCTIPSSLEAARLDLIMIVSLWIFTGSSAVLLPMYLLNFTVEKSKPEFRGLKTSRNLAKTCHHLNQCGHIVCWALKDKLHEIVIIIVFIDEMHLYMSFVKQRPRQLYCWCFNVLKIAYHTGLMVWIHCVWGYPCPHRYHLWDLGARIIIFIDI